jgi:drug/metabolite transporter (DMT)-like permease
VSSIYMKKYAAGAKPIAIAGWSQIFAALATGAVRAVRRRHVARDAAHRRNVLLLALLCSSIAYVLYYRLIADIGPTRALTMAFLMPAFGMLWGALFLDEPITLPMIAGCALIIGGAIGRAAAGGVGVRAPIRRTVGQRCRVTAPGAYFLAVAAVTCAAARRRPCC